MDAELVDVDLDTVGEFVGRTFDFELVEHDVHNAAEAAHALRRSRGDDGKSGLDGFVGGDALQVDVYDAPRDRIDLHFTKKCRIHALTVHRERDQRRARASMQYVVESPARKCDRLRL